MTQTNTTQNAVATTVRTFLVVLLALGMATAPAAGLAGAGFQGTGTGTAASAAADAATLDVGLELEQEESVDQGDDATITTWSNNRQSSQESGVTLELFVDADGDDQFESGEVEASRTVDLGAGAYETWDLAYTNVQLSPGTYEYATRASKNGQEYWSFTNGTLTVNASGSSSSPMQVGLELEQEESVDQGNDVNITTWSNNRKNSQESGVTLELFVDADDDNRFESGEVEVTRTVDFAAGAYETWELEYSNVGLSPGNYSYATRASKNGHHNWSFTNGTLTVDSGGSGVNIVVRTEQRESVDRGNDVNITSWIDNRMPNTAISGATVELLVDTDSDGSFEASEVVATRSASLPAYGYNGFNVTYANVGLAAGTYDYTTRVNYSGVTTWSSTNGTLTVNASGATPLDVGLELEQDESVEQGGDVNITTWSNNRKSSQITGVTLELYVDADGDDRFEAGEVEATRTVDLAASAYETWELEYANVGLSNGTYEYATRASANGKESWSFTNGTLTVGNASGTHQSGVPMALYDAVAGTDGQLSREDIISMVQQYVTTNEVNGVPLSRAEVIALVAFYVTG